jgi:hypothetical protein
MTRAFDRCKVVVQVSPEWEDKGCFVQKLRWKLGGRMPLASFPADLIDKHQLAQTSGQCSFGRQIGNAICFCSSCLVVYKSDFATSMAQKCVHKGCGKEFTDREEECVYHPGPPEFHEGQKGQESSLLPMIT